MKLKFESTSESFISNPFYPDSLSIQFLSFKHRHDFFTMLDQLHSLFREWGLGGGDVVAISGDLHPMTMAALIVLWNLDSIPMIYSPYWTEEQVNEMLERYSPTAWVNVKNNTHKIRWSGFYVSKKDLAHGTVIHPFQAKPSLSLNQPATILFTSGTTGSPKAVVHTWENHYYSALGIIEHFHLDENHSWILSLPLFHIGGLAILFRCAFSKATLILANPPESVFRKNVQLSKTFLSLVPTQLWRLLRKPENIPYLKQFKGILLGGSAIPDALIRRCLDEKIRIFTSYGSTEMASTITCTRDFSYEELTTAGYPLPYREMQINSRGELLVKGKSLFRGYIKKEKVLSAVENEGWYATGDLALVDSKGRLIVQGRKDHMFISGGENIQPEMIERELRKFPDVMDAIVVPVSDPEYGFRPVAFIRSSRTFNDQLREKLKAYVRDKLPGLFRPVEYYPLPEKSSGELKWSRIELQQLAATRYKK
jgi:O-succinylbenzoic acid--CoA ligase